ncbi:MAG: hypothetical protein M3483_05530 [Gemmatimonadota bacterium]|nr:hypothetical protein [Gemmatimonadota bacterium]
MRWGPEEVDRLERAIAEEQRIRIFRKGSEYVILPRALRSQGSVEEIVAVHPGTGEEIRFRLDELEYFSVLS